MIVRFMQMTQVLVFGDSIAYGAWDPKGGWVERLKRVAIQNVLEDSDLHPRVYNMSLSGDTTEWLLMRIAPELGHRLSFRDPGEETIVIFAIGINDTKFLLAQERTFITLERFRENIKTLIKAARDVEEVIPVFVGLTPVDEKVLEPLGQMLGFTYRNEQIRKFDEELRKVCEKEKVLFVPLLEEFEKEGLEGVLSDGLHPNSEGHKLVFKTVRALLESKKWL